MTTHTHRPHPRPRRPHGWRRRPLALALGMAVFVTACGSGDVSGTGEAAGPSDRPEEATTTSAASVPEGPRAPLTGLPVADATVLQRPALVVKIDNDPLARPQIGLNQADLVYEARVEGITRFAAVFHSGDADPVGPIRSARSTDIDLTANLARPLFAWSGANDTVTDEVLWAQETGVLFDISHNAAPDQYQRDPGRRAPHNLVGSTVGFRTHTPPEAVAPSAVFSYRDADEEPASTAPATRGVSVGYGSTRIHDVSFVWDPERQGWRRFQIDSHHDLVASAHLDALGEQVAPANVVVFDTEYKDSAAGAYPQAVTVGTGSATVLTAGRVVPVTWTRTAPTDPFTLTDPSGAAVELTAGQTWVLLPQPGNTTILDDARADELLAQPR